MLTYPKYKYFFQQITIFDTFEALLKKMNHITLDFSPYKCIIFILNDYDTYKNKLFEHKELHRQEYLKEYVEKSLVPHLKITKDNPFLLYKAYVDKNNKDTISLMDKVCLALNTQIQENCKRETYISKIIIPC